MRAIVKMYSDGADDFCNIEADKIIKTDDNLIILLGNDIVGFFGINDVKGAWLSNKK